MCEAVNRAMERRVIKVFFFEETVRQGLSEDVMVGMNLLNERDIGIHRTQ